MWEQATQTTTGRFLLGLLSVSLIALVAEVYLNLAHTPSYILPKPSLLISEFVRNVSMLFKYSIQTLAIFTLGFGIGTATGIVLGVLLYYTPLIRKGVLPLVVAFRSAPVFAFVALYLIWFGFGDIPKLIITAQVCFFPVFLNTLEGLDMVPREFLLLFRSLHATRWETLWKISFPSAIAKVLTGLRTTLIFAMVGTVVSEWIIGNTGMGSLIQQAARDFDTVLTFHIIIALGLMGLIMYGLIVMLANVFLKKYQP